MTEGFNPAPAQIRKLVRCKVTNAFLTKDHTWTHNLREAEDFQDVRRIHVLQRELQLENVELYCLFGDEPDPRYDFALSLDHYADVRSSVEELRSN